MWLFYRVFILAAFFAASGPAFADTTIIPAPSNAALAQQQQAAQIPPVQQPASNPGASPMQAQVLAPASVIQPLLSPRDQAIEQNRAAAAVRASQPTAPAVPAAAAQAAATSQSIAVAQQQAMMAAQQQQAQQAMAMQQQAAASQQGIIPPPQQQAPVAATPMAATPTPTAKLAPIDTPPAQPQLTQSFSSANTPGTIPTTTGMMPITNAGIDMHLTPNMVGSQPGDGQTPGGEQLPYEVQLQQRTQELQQQARGIAFDQAKRSALPMEPYEIRDVLGRLKDTQEAIQTPVRPAPKPQNVIQTISTDPGVKPQTIHLAASNVSTINIIDITGEPWPIVDIGFGGPFDVKPPEAGGNIIRIAPKKDFAHGNLVVRLLKMTTPLTFVLEAGGDTVDYRFDARIPENGPNAKMPVMAGGIGTVAGDKITTSFLEGVPPTGAEKAVVEGSDGRTSAYRYASALYVRTPLSLLSPAWQSSATSSDGMNIYVLEDTPVVLLSDKGDLVRVHIGQKASTNTADAFGAVSSSSASAGTSSTSKE